MTPLTLILLAAPALAAPQNATAPVEIRYPVNDSVTVIADVHRGSGGAGGATILLFHQGGGSARGEYRTIAPRLVDSGYNVVAADIRGGGDRFGLPNRVGPAPESFHYCDASAELEATVHLARAQGLSGPLVLWGSSYTATLALQAAARRSADVRAVLAFSPALGEPMRGCEPERYLPWLARAGVPALVLRPRREIEDRERAESLEAMRRSGAEVLVVDAPAHGSSILDAERTGAATEPQWRAVSAFLRRALEPRAAAPEERAVSIPSDGWTLRGDLRPPPKAPGPLVILLNKAAGDRRIYRELADRLAAAGIGSLRVDLRGHGASVNRGRFIPGPGALSLKETDRDVAAIWRFVRSQPGVDTTRLAVVGGSYSSQAAAVAAMRVGYGRAHVALSPGDFSDSSFRATGRGGAWLFVRSDSERFVGPWLDEKIRELAPSAELWVVPAGSAHATDLLAADSALPGRLTDWLSRHLTGAGKSVAAGVRLTYLANEGVVLESGRGRVFIDALFGDGLPDYPTVPRPMRDSLERALGDFGGPAVVLTTHPHRDHFDSAAVQRYLRANPAAVAFGPAGTALRPATAPADLGWVRVLPLPIRHGPTRRMVDHTAYVVTLEGVSALHIGDTGSDPATWPALGLPAGGVDLALLPYWYALDDAQFQAMLRVARPRHIALLHASIPQNGDPKATAEWTAHRRALLERYPQVWIPQRPGEVMDVKAR